MRGTGIEYDWPGRNNIHDIQGELVRRTWTSHDLKLSLSLGSWPRIRANGKLTLDVHRVEMKRPRRIYFARGVPLDTPQLSESNHRVASNTRVCSTASSGTNCREDRHRCPRGSADVDIRLVPSAFRTTRATVAPSD